MKIELIKGAFQATEALEILTKMIDVKIKFHESKIESTHHEEDIKMREQRIKELQKNFYEVQQLLLKNKNRCNITGVIELN